jgi:hypothetical protein
MIPRQPPPLRELGHVRRRRIRILLDRFQVFLNFLFSSSYLTDCFEGTVNTNRMTAATTASLRAKKSSNPIRDDATDTRINDAGAAARTTATCGSAYGASISREILSCTPALSTFPTTNWVAVLESACRRCGVPELDLSGFATGPSPGGEGCITFPRAVTMPLIRLTGARDVVYTGSFLSAGVAYFFPKDTTPSNG